VSAPGQDSTNACPPPDVILLGLHLMTEAGVSPAQMAGHFKRPVDAACPDRLVAFQDSILSRDPSLADTIGHASQRPAYEAIHCRSCDSLLRTAPGSVGRDATCPLCGEAFTGLRGRMFAADARQPVSSIAAEDHSAYTVGAAPMRFAHYDLGDLIGRGSTGKVYRAVNRRSGRSVALKVLSFQPLDSTDDVAARLTRETSVNRSIVHKNVVPVLDMGVCEGVPYIEMELVQASSLREYVRRNGPLPAGRACTVCQGALAGLGAVHAHGAVHGDVKPGNILLDTDGRARLTDFGLSRLVRETTSLGTKAAVGTPHYMAPEQWRGGSVGRAADIYGMGLVLLFTLTGRPPWEARTPSVLMYKHLHEPVLPPTGHILVPAGLADMITHATAKAAEDRFESAAEFADALAAWHAANA
jgi:serine/threonine protein kinase